MPDAIWEGRVRQVMRRRWIVWAPLAVALQIVYFHRVAAAVVADRLMVDFYLTNAATLGMLASVYFYTYAALQIPAGICADTWGPRKTIATGMTLAGTGSLFFALAPTTGMLYAGRFLASMGVGLVYINMVKIHAAWFRTREFGTISGISSLIGNLGSILAATPLALMVNSIGWRVSFGLIGIITLFIALSCWLIVRNTPQELGLPSMAEIEHAEGSTGGVNPSRGVTSVREALRLVWGNPYTWPPFFASFGLYGTFMTFTGMWGVPYLMQVYGMSRVEAANYMLAAAVGVLCGAPALGYVSDRLGTRKKPYLTFAVLYSCVWLALALGQNGAPPRAFLYPLCFSMGFFSAAVSLTLACAKEANHPTVTGIATGTANGGAFIGTAIIQPLFGHILERYWAGMSENGVKIYPLAAYQAGFIACCVILLLAVTAASLIKETHCQNSTEESLPALSRKASVMAKNCTAGSAALLTGKFNKGD